MLKFKGFEGSLKSKSTASRTFLSGSVKSLLCAFTLSGVLASSAYAGNTATDFMKTSMSKMFDYVNNFECEGGERSAICKIDRYEIGKTSGFVLRDYRYTVDYKDSRVIERMSAKVEAPRNHDLKAFVPTYFECSDFTQIHNEKSQVNKQLVCMVSNDLYKLNIRLRSKATSSLFANVDSMSLLQKSATFWDKMLKEVIKARDEKQLTKNIRNILSDIDVNLYGIDIAITKPQLPQKIYEHIFADMIDYSNEASDYASERYNQQAHAIYNSGVGYIYGNIMGYVWGNDTIDDRTKESLNKLFVALRDSAMLDSNIKTIYITITNRTNKGFNLSRAYDKVTRDAEKLDQSGRDVAGQVLDLFNGDVFNRYRIEVGVARFK